MKVSLLFALTIFQLNFIDSLFVEIQLVDKLVRPWEMLLERGLLNLSTKKYGLWNQNLDGSIIILKSWLTSITSETFIFKHFEGISTRFLKILPFWMHFSGQTSKIQNLNSTISKDLSFMCMKIMGKEFLTESTKLLEILLNTENDKHGYFEIQKLKESENDENLKVNYEICLTVLEESKDEEILLDYKIESLKLILKQFESSFTAKILILLMSECLKIWMNENDVVIRNDDVRFVPELENIMNKTKKKFPTIYILVNIAEYFLDLKIDYDNNILNDMLKISEVCLSFMKEKKVLTLLKIFHGKISNVEN